MFGNLLYLVPSFLIAVTIHETAHAVAAKLLGDPTAEKMGRISLNPLRHLDVMGTIMIFLVGFGWGKPVPIDDRYFKHRKLGNAISAFAGPLSNVLLAAIALVLMKHLPLSTVGVDFLRFFTSINLILAVFNLIPVPPLDGSHILALFWPASAMDIWLHIEENGPFVLFFILLADNFFHIGLIGNVLRFFTDFLYLFLYSLS